MKNKFVDPELNVWKFPIQDVVATDMSVVPDDGIDTPNYPI